MIQLLPGIRIKVPNRHSTYGRVKVKTIQLFLGKYNRNQEKTQKYFSLYGCLFNRPAEMAEKAEIFSLYGCIRVIREIRVPLHHSLYGCFLIVPQKSRN